MLKEAIKLRLEMEKSVYDIIKEFENKTGLRVERIDTQRNVRIGGSRVLTAIETTVELP